VVTAQDAVANRTEIPVMSSNTLTDTQLVLLSAAAQHPEGAIDLPSTVNLKTAKALGLTIPSALIVTAEVIE
jgi:hypothetical protein